MGHLSSPEENISAQCNGDQARGSRLVCVHGERGLSPPLQRQLCLGILKSNIVVSHEASEGACPLPLLPATHCSAYFRLFPISLSVISDRQCPATVGAMLFDFPREFFLI